MNNDDINNYLPSILNPRAVKKEFGDLTLTQNSIVSRCSLSLKRKNGICNVRKNIQKVHQGDKENSQNTNNSTNLIRHLSEKNKNVFKDKTSDRQSFIFSPPQRNIVLHTSEKENMQEIGHLQNNIQLHKIVDEAISLGLSAVEDIHTENRELTSSPFSFEDLEPVQNNVEVKANGETLRTVSSATELNEEHDLNKSLSTIVYEVPKKPIVNISFGIANCNQINVSTNNSRIKNILVTQNNNDINIDCEMEESSHITISDDDETSSLDAGPTPPKKSAVTVNLEIKKKKTPETPTENSKVLILNTDAIERLSHVIIQPLNYKLVKRQNLDRNKFKNNSKWKLGSVRNGELVRCGNLKQKRIDCFFTKSTVTSKVSRTLGSVKNVVVASEDDEDMSRNLGVATDAAKCERSAHRAPKSARRQSPPSPEPRPLSRNIDSPHQQCVKNCTSEGQRCQSRLRNHSASSSPSPRKHVESVQFTLPTKGLMAKSCVSPKCIPYYKIVADTHFAVDAFSYGDIPNVEHYFLTHFHSDHYSGLKKGFNKSLFCTKITADLCVARLGVHPKVIHIINFDDTIVVDGVEITAVDANHCPGAMMLIFTLPKGKTVVHTGDFRASPNMESYPIFWNKDVHTIYLDSTYCNPRYDFPTQDQSLEMALYLLQQKKKDLENAGKKFSSVLIVCGTYTIGKEKFFLGMARRVGCEVWACPEKDKVLQVVEGRSFSLSPPTACQLHVVPMRDLTHEKLKNYMDSLHGAFAEVVAFKPSGWENGKNSCVQKDSVTIHGIPYSEHSSFSEMIRFVKFLKPKQVVPTVDISGGVKAVQKYFPCPLVNKDSQTQSKVSDYFSIQNRQQVPAVT